VKSGLPDQERVEVAGEHGLDVGYFDP